MEFLSLKDHVYNYIAKQIRNGNLESNEKVNEQDICQQLDISRTPVREALIQLAADGFLESAPRRGFRVKPLTRKEGQDIYQVLSVLDELAIALAMERLSDEDFEKMYELIDLMDFYIDRFDFDKYFSLQENFHDVYINRTENDTLINTISRLQRRFVRQKHTYGEDNSDLADLLRKTNEQHKHIVDLLKAGDKEEVQRFVRNQHWNYHYSEADRTGSIDDF